MNDGDSHLHPWIEPELEARIIALVLGEASDFEAEELERLIGEQPELTMFRNRMEAIHGLLHEASAGEPEDADDTWKLPQGRREAVMAVIEGREVKPMSELDEEAEDGAGSGRVQDDPEVGIVETMSTVPSGRGNRRGTFGWIKVVSIAAAACLFLFVGFASLMGSKLGSKYLPAASADMALARTREDFGIDEEATSYSVTRGTRTDEDTPTQPRRWASQPGVIRTEAVVALNDGASTDFQSALSYDAESEAATSLGRLKGVFGNMNTLAGVDSGLVDVGGMTVVSSLDVDSSKFLTDQRSILEHGAGSDLAELQMPETDSLVRNLETNLAGNVEVSTDGRGITIRAYNTPDLSQPISTAGKSDLSFPEMPKDASANAFAVVGHGGRESDRLAYFDVNVQDFEKAPQPEGGSQPGKAPESDYAGFGMVAEAGKPVNQLADAIESEVISESLMAGTQAPIAMAGTAGSTFNINGAISPAGSTGSGGTVTLGKGVNVSGGVISANGGNVGGVISIDGSLSEGDKGRKDLEELEGRSKRELAENAQWGQVGGMAESPANDRLARKQPAPASSPAPVPAKPKPPARGSRDLATVTAVTGPVAAPVEPMVISGNGGLIEVSGKANLKTRTSTVTEDGAAISKMALDAEGGPVLFDSDNVVVGNHASKLLADLDTESTPAPAELPAIGMESLGEEQVLAQVELQLSEQVSELKSLEAAESRTPQNSPEVYLRKQIAMEAKSESEQARDKVPALGDLPVAGRLFRQGGRGGAQQELAKGVTPASSAAELSKLANLTSPLAVRDEQRFGEFDNGLGNSVDGAYINKPDEGNSHSMNGTDDVFTRDFLGGANNLRGFDSQEVGPKSAETSKPQSEIRFDSKSGGNDDLNGEGDSKTREVHITSKFVEVDESKKGNLGFGWMSEGDGGGGGGGAAPAGGPAPADRPIITESQEQSDRGRLPGKGHGQVTPIEITGQMKTKDQAVRRELAVTTATRQPGRPSNPNPQANEQLGAGGYDSVRGFEKRVDRMDAGLQPVTAGQPASAESLKRDTNAPVAVERNSRSKALGRSDGSEAAKQKGNDELAVRLNLAPEIVEFEGFINYGAAIDHDGDGNNDGLAAITDGRKSGSKRMPAEKVAGDDAKTLGKPEVMTLGAGAQIDVSGAMGGGNVTIGGGFQGNNVVGGMAKAEDATVMIKGRTAGEPGTNNNGSIEGTAEEMKTHGNVYALSIDNSGAVRVTAAARAGGRVTLNAPGGTITNTGSIQARTPNGAGGEILVEETLEESEPQQSLDAIKDSLAMNPPANGAIVNWSDFSVSAGEVSEFTQPGQKVRGLNRVIAGNPVEPGGAPQPDGGKSKSDEFLYEDFFPADYQNVAPSSDSIRSQVPSTLSDGGAIGTNIRAGTEIDATITLDEPWYFRAEATQLNPNTHAGGDEWATPMAGGDIERGQGRFASAQHEWQRYPGHPATTATAPVAAEGEEESGEAIQWTNSQTLFGGFVSGVVDGGQHIRTSGNRGLGSDLEIHDVKRGDINVNAGGNIQMINQSDSRENWDVDPTSGADINVNLTGGLLMQSGGRHDNYNHIGHGGGGTSWADRTRGENSQSGATRQWKEGFAEGNPTAVTSGLRSGANAIDGDSIDGLITSIDAKDYYDTSRDRTRSEFLWGIDQSWELPATVTSRSGQREQIEVIREFVYPTEYDPPELPAKIALKKRVAPPAGLDEKNAADESFSTFSLHVSDVSFKLAQAALAKGEWPEAGKVRIEEFVNAFDYGDPNPSQDDKVACRVEQAIHPFLQQRNLMRVAMRTAAAGRAGDTPLRLTFLLDNSGSMERADREETVRRAFALLADQLQPIDQVTLISFARQPRLLADKVSGDQSRKLVEVVGNLPSEGGTNLEAALQLAFEKAQEQKADKAQNRIVLLTDGAANLGNAKPESLARMVESMREEGIAFDAAGIGADGLNDDILEALTRKGDGRYYLLNRPEDADDGFARQIAGALRPAAKNVKVQVEFNPDRVGNYKLLGFEKHILKKEDFRDDTVDAAEMAAEEAGVAVYQFEAKPDGDGQGDVGFVSVRFRDMSSGEMVEKRWPIPYEPSAPRPDQAAPSMQIATAAALLAAKLNSEPLGETVDLDELARTVSSLPESFQSKERVQQLRQMIDQARELAAK